MWTGSEMIIWGGYGSNYLDSGGRYNPAGNTWTATSTVGAAAARYEHTAVWTGSEMIVWGGFGSSYLGNGGRYDSAANSWTAVSTTGAPAARYKPERLKVNWVKPTSLGGIMLEVFEFEGSIAQQAS